MAHETLPPSDACLGCAAYQAARSWRKWSVILAVAALGAIVPTVIATSTACATSAEARAQLGAVTEAQGRAREERQRAMAAIHEGETKAATDGTELARSMGRIETMLARIETRLDGLEERQRRRRLQR